MSKNRFWTKKHKTTFVVLFVGDNRLWIREELLRFAPRRLRYARGHTEYLVQNHLLTPKMLCRRAHGTDDYSTTPMGM